MSQAKRPKKIDPSMLGLEDLRDLAQALINPPDGHEVVIAVMPSVELDLMEAGEEPPADELEEEETVADTSSNVVELFPMTWRPSEYQQERQAESLGLILSIADGIEKGMFRDFAIVVGNEKNEMALDGITSFATTGVLDNPLTFVGGLEFLKAKIIRQDEVVYDDED